MPQYAGMPEDAEVVKYAGMPEDAEIVKGPKQKAFGGKDVMQGVNYPGYRDQLNQFIRKQAPRNIKQEAVRGLPFGPQIADATLGQYINPVHPEETTDQMLGPQEKNWQNRPIDQSPGVMGRVAQIATAPIRGFENLLTNKATVDRSIGGAMAFPATMPYEATKALIADAKSPDDAPSEVGKMTGELVKGMFAPVGLTDLASGDPSMPAFRNAWEKDPVGSALITEGNVKGALKAKEYAGIIKEKVGKGFDYAFGMKPDEGMFKRSANDTLNRVMPKKTSPGGKSTGKMDAAAEIADARAVDFLHRPENADILPISDGDSPIKASELDSVSQYQAINNGIDKLLKVQDGIIKEAGESGLVHPIQPLKDFWKGVIASAEKGTKGADRIAHANKELSILEEKGDSFDLDGALEDLTTLNQQLQKGGVPIDNSVRGDLAKEATLRRRLLDELLTENPDERFSDLRKDMGALIQLRDRNGKLLHKIAKQPEHPGSIMGDYAIGQMAYGAMSMNPAAFLKGGLIAGTKAYRKIVGDPNYQIKRMHERAAKLREQPKEIPVAPPNSPWSSPEDIEPDRSRRDMDQSPDLERGGRYPDPSEIDPNLRDIAPKEEVPLWQQALEKGSVQFDAGGSPRGTMGTNVTESGRTPGEPKFEPFEAVDKHPQDWTDLDILNVRKELTGKGFTPEQIQSFVDLSKKYTPSSFPMYEGVTGIFKMLQDQIAKEGGGAKGVGKVAFKIGVPAALIDKFLSGNDEERKKMLAMPIMAGLVAFHGSPLETAKKIRKEGVLKPFGEEGVKKVNAGLTTEEGLVWLSNDPSIARFFATGGEHSINRPGAVFRADLNDNIKLLDMHRKLTSKEVEKLNKHLPDYKPMYKDDTLMAWSWRSNGKPIKIALKELGYEGIKYGDKQIAVLIDKLPVKLSSYIKSKKSIPKKLQEPEYDNTKSFTANKPFTANDLIDMLDQI